MPFSTTTFLIRSRRETSYQGALAFQSSSIKSQVLPEPLMVRVPAGALYICGGGLILSGGYAVLVEWLLNVTFRLHDTFLWSFYPLAVCTVLGAMLLVIAGCKPLRRSLHRKFFL